MRTLVFAAALLAATAAQAATVTADHGNILLDGKAITHSGQDSDPVIAPDGKRVVFRRALAGKPIADCSANMMQAQPAELWSVNADGRGARKLLTTVRGDDVHHSLCDFSNLQFSSDGNLLYSETPAWATSGAIHVYDFRSGKEHFVIDGDGLKVLANCTLPEHRDQLIVTQHRYFVFGGSYDWPWLVSPAGKVLGLVGGDEANVDQIVREACT